MQIYIYANFTYSIITQEIPSLKPLINVIQYLFNDKEVVLLLNFDLKSNFAQILFL